MALMLAIAQVKKTSPSVILLWWGLICNHLYLWPRPYSCTNILGWKAGRNTLVVHQEALGTSLHFPLTQCVSGRPSTEENRTSVLPPNPLEFLLSHPLPKHKHPHPRPDSDLLYTAKPQIH